jgi:hypothetical protein
VYVPTLDCGSDTCLYCTTSTWVLLERVNRYFVKWNSLAEGVETFTRTSGVLEGNPALEVYSWIWTAKEGERMNWEKARLAVDG